MISAVILTKDEENNILECLKSIDYELIIVNDGSKDNTKKIAEGYSKKYQNITVINKLNGGKASAMNEGIKIAKGEFVVSFDADSMVRSDAIRNMLIRSTD